MDSKNIFVIVLTVIAISWRLFTWTSLDRTGYIGLTKNDFGIITRVSHESPAADAGFLVGDKILSVAGTKEDELPRPFQNLEYTIERNATQLVISLIPSENVNVNTKILGVMGILILSIGLLIFYQNNNLVSFAFFLYCCAMCLHWGSYPLVAPDYSQNIIRSLYVFFSIFLGSTMLHFGMIYPKSPTLSLKKYLMIYSSGIIGVVFLGATLINMDLLSTFGIVEPILVNLFAIAGIILLFRTYFKTPSGNRRSIGIRIICWGILLANLPYIFSTFLPFMNFGGTSGAMLYRLLFIIQPIALAIAIRRFNRSLQVG